MSRHPAVGIIAVLAVFAAVAACSPKTPPTGAQVYAQNCGRCHQFRSPVEFTDAQWHIITAHMRVVAGLPGKQARDVRDYLVAQNNPPPMKLPDAQPSVAVPAGASSAEQGKLLTEDKQCRACHEVEGSGGTLGPNLDTVFERRDRAFVKAKLLDPKTDNPQSMMPNLGFSDQDADAIVDYLFGLQSSR